MGNRRTEGKKRGAAAGKAKWRCRDCRPEDIDLDVYRRPAAWCDKHRCAATTRAGRRCQNSATYPDEGLCGVHA